MMNSALHLVATAFDFRFKQRDALLQFLDRIGIEILPAELGDKIVLAPGKIFVCVHCKADR